MLEQASNLARTVDNIFLFITLISVALLLGVTVCMIYFVYRYHKTRHTTPEEIEGNLPLEITWTVIPTILVMAMFYYGWIGFKEMRSPPENAMRVNVTGRMWSWAFEYENGKKSDQLYLPIEKPVKLLIHSQDVLHSFYIPAFRIKEDAVPGLETFAWLTPIKEGEYDIQCAEFCGQRHSYMLTKAKVVSEEAFKAWYEEGLPSTSESRGKQIVQEKGCIACHTLDGTQLIAPSFKGLFGKKERVVRGGKVEEVLVDEGYIKSSVQEPNAQIVEGFQPLMPPQSLSEEELQAVVQFLKELP